MLAPLDGRIVVSRPASWNAATSVLTPNVVGVASMPVGVLSLEGSVASGGFSAPGFWHPASSRVSETAATSRNDCLMLTCSSRWLGVTTGPNADAFRERVRSCPPEKRATSRCSSQRSWTDDRTRATLGVHTPFVTTQSSVARATSGERPGPWWPPSSRAMKRVGSASTAARRSLCAKGTASSSRAGARRQQQEAPSHAGPARRQPRGAARREQRFSGRDDVVPAFRPEHALALAVAAEVEGQRGQPRGCRLLAHDAVVLLAATGAVAH